MLRFLAERAQSEKRKRLHSEVSITARPVFERHGFKVLAYQTVQIPTVAPGPGQFPDGKLL